MLRTMTLKPHNIAAVAARTVSNKNTYLFDNASIVSCLNRAKFRQVNVVTEMRHSPQRLRHRGMSRGTMALLSATVLHTDSLVSRGLPDPVVSVAWNRRVPAHRTGLLLRLRRRPLTCRR